MASPRVWFAILAVTLLVACAKSSSGDDRSDEEAGIWGRKSSSLDPSTLPLGNKKYVTDGPKAGHIYTCSTKYYEFPNVVGATKVGNWVGSSTFDITAKPSVQGAVYRNGRLDVVATGDSRAIKGNGLPVNVPTGVFPTLQSDPAYAFDRNPSTIEEQEVSFSIPLNPTFADKPVCVELDVGITLDGVQLSTGLDSSGRDELAYEMMDQCSGMAQPGGLYHRHSLSDCIPGIHDAKALVGFALDGFGIFSPYDENGNELTSKDLDECHGTTSDIMWNGQLVNMYHYVLTRDFPYSVTCFKGTPTRNAFPARPPPQLGNGSRPSRPQPPGFDELLKQYDKDGDHALDEQEFAAHSADAESKNQPGMPPVPAWGDVVKFDDDASRTISSDEFAKLVESRGGAERDSAG